MQRRANESGERPTLLFGLKQKTISECTFRVRNRPSRLSLMALNVDANAWILDVICSFQSASLYMAKYRSVNRVSSRDMRKMCIPGLHLSTHTQSLCSRQEAAGARTRHLSHRGRVPRGRRIPLADFRVGGFPWSWSGQRRGEGKTKRCDSRKCW